MMRRRTLPESERPFESDENLRQPAPIKGYIICDEIRDRERNLVAIHCIRGSGFEKKYGGKLRATRKRGLAGVKAGKSLL